MLAEETKFAHLGKPGTTFSAGFARRLRLMQEVVDFRGKKILDVGCGGGVWLAEFAKLAGKENVYGSDIDGESMEGNPDFNFKICPAEKLDFEDSFFDIVFSHEVLEHVVDDKQAVREAIRVLKPGGKLIIFAPNRGWPFETHGMFVGGKYIWGNIPFLPWMPGFIYRRLAPHVRNYCNGDMRRLFAGLPVNIIYHKHVFPGFDGLIRRFGILGKAVRGFFHALEKTPLHFFGISHFLVVERVG